ncbi:MAG: RDD family protein [Planctomycetes bacterium]|nr:RDD family protein [Planctomycetota bacterium]
MSQHDSRSGQPLKASYVILLIALTILGYAASVMLPWVIAVSLGGPFEWRNLLQSRVPESKFAVLWNDDVCIPSLTLNMLSPGRMVHSLEIINPQTRETRSIKTSIPPGKMKLVPDGNQLWCLSGSIVHHVQDDVVTETSTGLTLKSPESAFLYEGQLAVLEETFPGSGSKVATPVHQLLVWSNDMWQNRGRILLPKVYSESTEGSAGNSPSDDQSSAPANPAFQGVSEVHVLNFQGQLHLFCSDGSRVLYSNRLEIVPAEAASALDVENAEIPLPGWILVGNHTQFDVGSDAEGLLLVEQNANFRSGSMSTDATVVRLSGEKWTKSQTWQRAGLMIEPHLISNGKTAYIIGQTLGNHLALCNLQKTEVRLPFSASPTMDRLAQSVQKIAWWASYPILILYALIVSRLMTAYRSSRYEYGNRTVELASMTRRAIAKIVDVYMVSLPLLVLQWVYIGSQAEMQEWLLDKMSTLDLQLFTMMMFGVLGLVVYAVTWLLVLGVLQGRWGISPGKWLLGIRVVRTTLRPCGVFRGTLREIMSLIDGMICFAWVPGALFFGLTSLRQRIGDLVGDTIVIRKPGSESFTGEAVLKST